MKKLISVFMAIICAFACFALTSCSSSEDTIIVQTNAYFAPFEYFSNGTKIAGVDVDIMSKVGEKLGKEVEFQSVDFSVIIDNVSKGKICDCGAAGITITEERKGLVDFSIPYYTSVQYVIYKTDTMEKSGTDDGVDYILWTALEGKKIGVQQDTTGDFYVTDEINAVEGVDGYDFTGILNGSGATVAKYENAQLAVDAINAEQLDVVVVDKLPANYIVDKNSGYACAALYYPGEGDEADSPTSEQYAICVTKGNTDLLNAINEVLTDMMKVDATTNESQIDSLVKTHMGMN